MVGGMNQAPRALKQRIGLTVSAVNSARGPRMSPSYSAQNCGVLRKAGVTQAAAFSILPASKGGSRRLGREVL